LLLLPVNNQVVAFSFLYLQPLHRGWSSWAYSKLMLVLVFSQALKVNTAHGWPAAWNLAAVKQWLMRVVPTSDAQYFLLAFAAAGNSTKPITAVLPPFLVMAAYTLAHFLSSTVGTHPLWQWHGVHLYRQMQAKQQVALAFTAQSEIMLGFLLLLGLPFPSRAPVFAYMVANFLRMRYWSADGALYHRQVRLMCRPFSKRHVCRLGRVCCACRQLLFSARHIVRAVFDECLCCRPTPAGLGVPGQHDGTLQAAVSHPAENCGLRSALLPPGAPRSSPVSSWNMAWWDAA
jgi:hypothetical protein